MASGVIFSVWTCPCGHQNKNRPNAARCEFCSRFRGHTLAARTQRRTDESLRREEVWRDEDGTRRRRSASD